MDRKKTDQAHPSYGVVSFSRFTTRDMTLFDSPFRHHHGIMLTICRASKERDLYNDRVRSEDELIEIAMSELQFANLITSANMGSGAPCTIVRFNGESMEAPPQDNIRKTFKDDVTTVFSELAVVADQLDALVNKKDAKADDRKQMRALSGQLTMAFKQNLSWMQQQFEEQIEKAVSAAKAEIQAHAEHVVLKAGLQALDKSPVQFKLEM
jgi:hypothetical protein